VSSVGFGFGDKLAVDQFAGMASRAELAGGHAWLL